MAWSANVNIRRPRLGGYLSQTHAIRYRPAIDLVASKKLALGRRASLVGGWDRGAVDPGEHRSRATPFRWIEVIASIRSS